MKNSSTNIAKSLYEKSESRNHIYIAQCTCNFILYRHTVFIFEKGPEIMWFLHNMLFRFPQHFEVGIKMIYNEICLHHVYPPSQIVKRFLKKIFVWEMCMLCQNPKFFSLSRLWSLWLWHLSAITLYTYRDDKNFRKNNKNSTKTKRLFIISLALASVLEGCFYLEIYSLTILLQFPIPKITN